MQEFLLFAAILGVVAAIPRYKSEKQRWAMREQLRQIQIENRLLF